MPELEPSLYYFSGVVDTKGPRHSSSGDANHRGHSRIPAPPTGTVVVAAGRRAGTVRDGSDTPATANTPPIYQPSGINPSYNPQAGGSPNGPRYGRRASDADPSMDPAQSAQQQSALAKLKILSNSRVVRAPSPSATLGDSGYVPSSVTTPPGSSSNQRPAPIPRSPAAPPPASSSSAPQFQSSRPPVAKARPPSVPQRPQWSDDTEVDAPAPPPPAPAPPPVNSNRTAALQALAARKAQQQQQEAAPPEPPPTAPKRTTAAPPARAAAAPPPKPAPPPPQPAPAAPPAAKPAARAPPPCPPPPPSNAMDIDAIPIGGGMGGGFGSSMDELPPGAIAPVGPLIQCESCGRKFNEKALKVHSKVCKKVFVDERKKFDVDRVGKEATELAKKAEKAAKKDPKAAAAAAAAAGKKAKWKQQSDQLRAAMAANREIAEAKKRGEDVTKIKFVATAEEDDDRVPCPHCGRKFAEKAAERHIPHCAETMKKKGPPPKKPVGKK